MNDHDRQAARRRYDLLQRRADAVDDLIGAVARLRVAAQLVRLAQRQIEHEIGDCGTWRDDLVGHGDATRIKGFAGGEELLAWAVGLVGDNNDERDHQQPR